MVELDSRSFFSRRKVMYGSTDSVIVSSPDSIPDDSSNFILQSGNETTEDESSGSQDHLKPLYECSSSGEWYYLPRSSPVISRRARFHALEGIELQPPDGSSPLSLSSTPPSQNRTSSTSSNSAGFYKDFTNMQELPVGLIVASSGSRSKTAQLFPQTVTPSSSGEETCFTEQVTEPAGEDQGSPGSPSPPDPRGRSLSDEMVQHLNGSQNRTSTDAQIISGPVNEKQISEDLYRNSMDLDQENAHFVVVDMVLEVLESVKWAVSQQKLKDTDGSDEADAPGNSKTHSFSFSDSGYEDYCGRRFSSTRSSRSSIRRSLKASRWSAESLAQRLLTELRKQKLSEQTFICYKPGLEEFPLDTVSMVTGGGVRLSEEIRMRSRMRGTLTWAPPRFQIIFNVQPNQRRSDVIAAQHFLCAGCGTEVEPRYIKRLRYCEYLGRYFCDSCHSGGDSMIPGRVLSRWDFGRYPVSSFSKQLLDSIWEQPLFKLSAVAKNLYSQAKELQRFRELQEQLISIKKLLKACRLSEGILSDFQQLPSHLTEELHLFSMDDLFRVKRGQIFPTAKAMLRTAAAHVEVCELCQAKGFICEFCRGPDVLFPFQTDICTRCRDCRACFHTACFRDESCPRCSRLQIRKSLLSSETV
ncbi:protein associated with UVRAG as autophagy enhancer isoform X2 [Astyanax mexicanus]|uniref:protein associated with UVRAG as autophagy enhancer isoform X2 n=1 Tax=Astyanax mexicanus TaxID=7994 RepID=UPI0020CB16C7|nr:protein associated with UVRAG as autophagy enhancer isoform X2 [Astyanax mexicanus]